MMQGFPRHRSVIEGLDCMTSGTNTPLALWLLHEDEIDSWRAGQSPPARQWLLEKNFKGEKQPARPVAEGGGGRARAVAGVWQGARGRTLVRCASAGPKR